MMIGAWIIPGSIMNVSPLMRKLIGILYLYTGIQGFSHLKKSQNFLFGFGKDKFVTNNSQSLVHIKENVYYI
jgi:hypothetical protein